MKKKVILFSMLFPFFLSGCSVNPAGSSINYTEIENAFEDQINEEISSLGGCSLISITPNQNTISVSLTNGGGKNFGKRCQTILNIIENNNFADFSEYVIKITEIVSSSEKMVKWSSDGEYYSTLNGIKNTVLEYDFSLDDLLSLDSATPSSDTYDAESPIFVSDSYALSAALQEKLVGIEKNSNDSLNKIIEIAKNDSALITEDDISLVISSIAENHPHYYDGPEQMELYMYYGYLLDFSFDDSDPRSELGMDTYQAIKYVYRGTETVLDSSTKANLDQIEEDLQKIN